MEIQSDINVMDSKNIEKYPFSKIEIGQSFFIPGNSKQHATKLHKNLSAIANVHRKRKNKKFITRRTAEEGKEGVRIWRIQ